MDMDDNARQSDDYAEEKLDNEGTTAQLELELDPEPATPAEETDALK